MWDFFTTGAGQALVVAAGVAPLVLYWALTSRGRPEAISSIERTGKVMLRGTVVAMEECLVSPLSGRTCVGWEMDVVAKGGTPDAPLIWPKYRNRQAVDFFIDDGSGQARIVASNMKLVFPGAQNRDRQTAPQEEISEGLDEALQHGGVEVHDLRVRGKLRIFEHILESGQEVIVEGVAALEVCPGAGRGFRDLGTRPFVQGGTIRVA